MSTKSVERPAREPTAPFGTEPRRPRGPLVLLGVLYLCWFLFLLWLAAFHTGQ